MRTLGPGVNVVTAHIACAPTAVHSAKRYLRSLLLLWLAVSVPTVSFASVLGNNHCPLHAASTVQEVGQRHAADPAHSPAAHGHSAEVAGVSGHYDQMTPHQQTRLPCHCTGRDCAHGAAACLLSTAPVSVAFEPAPSEFRDMAIVRFSDAFSSRLLRPPVAT
jgi:hypothetical protein